MSNMHRRGWMQAFLIAFFVLIVIVAIILLSLDRKLLQDQRPQLKTDLAQDGAQAQLISLLRQREDGSALSELIILNERPNALADDKAIAERIDGFFTPNRIAYEMSIVYPGRAELTVRNAELREWAASKGLPQGTALLPGPSGNIGITLYVAPPRIYSVYGTQDFDKLELHYERVNSSKTQEALRQAASQGEAGVNCITEEQYQAKLAACLYGQDPKTMEEPCKRSIQRCTT